MTIANAIRSFLSRTPVVKALTFDDVWNSETGSTSSGKAVLSESVDSYIRAYRQFWAIRRCVDLRASLISSVPLVVEQKASNSEWEQVDDDFGSLLKTDQDGLTPVSVLISDIEKDLGVNGGAWVVIGRTGKGAPHGMFRLDPQYIKEGSFEFDESGSHLRGVNYQTDNMSEPKFIPSERLIRVYYPSRKNYFDEESPVESIRLEAEAAINSTRWNSSFFGNGAKVSGVLEVPGPLHREKAEFLRDQFNAMYSGVDNVGKNMVLEGGMTYKATGTNPHDADYLKMREAVARAAVDIYGIPPSLLSTTGMEAIRNAWEFNTILWHTTLIPQMKFIEESINHRAHQLLPSTKDKRIRFDYDEVPALQRDRLMRANEISKAVGAPWISRNEARQEDGLPPVAPQSPQDSPERDDFGVPVSPYKYDLNYRGKDDSNSNSNSNVREPDNE